MEPIPISKFKATCLAVLERVNNAGNPIFLTRFDKPIATITPPGIAQHLPCFGAGIGSAEILGDPVGSINHESDWEAVQDSELHK